MKASLFLFCLFVFDLVAAQKNYSEAMEQGDEAFRNGLFKIAINKYFAPEVFDTSKKEKAKIKVNEVFDEVSKLKKS